MGVLFSTPLFSEEILGAESVESRETQEAARGIVAAARALPNASQKPPQSPEADDPDSEPAEDYDRLRHFDKIADDIFRSGRLDRQGLERLYDLGIRTILNLEGEGAYRKENQRLVEIERNRKATGKPDWHITTENVPMSVMHAPKPEQIDHALAILADPARRPVLVHCEHGSDRTGVVVAAYRVESEKTETIDEAAREAKDGHCCHLVIKGENGLKNFLIKYHQYRSKTPPAP